MNSSTVNNKPREIFYLSIWQGAFDPIVGQEIKVFEFQQTLYYAQNAIKWSFHGKWATVCVVAPYGDFNQAQALKFATAWMLGKCTDYAVNLDRCTIEVKQGIEKTPRH